MEELKKSSLNNIEIPKHKDFNQFIATRESLKVGDFFADGERLVRITEITDRVKLSVVDIDTYEIQSERWSNELIDDFLKHYSNSYIPDIEEYKTQAQKILFEDKAFEVDKNPLKSDNDEYALVHKANKAVLNSIHAELELQHKRVEIVRNICSIMVQKKRNELDQIRRKLDEQLSVFQKEMGKIMKVIGMIELYLGIEEELYQLQEGIPADIDTPLSLRQLVLYADQELGNCDDGGIDYSQLNLFDEWLVKDQNYKILLPEERGIVALKPRRYAKEYNDNLTNAINNEWNRETYFLIRNGENIYRVFTQHIQVGETMFPKRDELQKLMSIASGQDKLMDAYMKFMLFLQGLLDRTSIFEPIEPGIKVSDIEQSKIQLIYDGEMTLSDGRLSFNEWRKKINENVGRGSRIVLIPRTERYSVRDNYWYNKSEGFLKYYNNEYSCPTKPSPGLYVVEEATDDEYVSTEKRPIALPCVRYLPKDDVFSWDKGFTERKKRVTWIISYKDSWYLNYDQISLEDIDFYLNSRIERKDYLNILPLLRELKKRLIEEQRREEDFKKMLFGLSLIKKVKVTEQDIQDAIDWWKFKNIWKRPITQDDEKAVRMITKKLGLN